VALSNFVNMLAVAAGVTGLIADGGVCATPARWGAADVLVEPSPFNAVQGLTVDHEGRLFAASIFGGQIWSIDRATGATKVIVDRPEGQSDDIAFGPHGEMAWTSLLAGDVRYREHEDSGKIQVLASNLPGIDSIRFDPRSGRLYVTQDFLGDALWEIDRSGVRPPRLIARNIGWLNGFDFGADGMIYGPLQGKAEIARIDPANGHITVIASGFSSPSGLKIAPNGDLWVVDAGNGQLVHIDRLTYRKTVAMQFEDALDNLAISREGEIYVSDPARSAIWDYTPASGKLRQLVPTRVAIPAGLEISDGRLYVADAFEIQSVDLKSKAIREESHYMNTPFPFTVSHARGRLAVSSIFSNVVEVFDQAWRPIATIAGLAAPSDALLLDDGSLIYSEYGKGQIVRASGADYAKREIVVSGLNGPIQMTVAHDGNLYVTENSGILAEISLASPGKARDVISGLMEPEGVAETPWGTLVVAEAGRHSLIEVDPKTGTKSVIADNLPIGLAVKSVLPPYTLPVGVAVDHDGTIYLSADVNNAIYRFRVSQ